MKALYKILLLSGCVLVNACNSESSHSQNTSIGVEPDVLTNGILVTPDSTVSGYSIRIEDGKIAEIVKGLPEAWNDMATLDLKGAYIYAGFIDAHAHFVNYAKSLQSVDLRGTTSWEDVVERTVEFAETHSNYTFITGRGWDQNDWSVQEFPTNSMLNEAFPDIPVVLTRIDGHAVLANQAALNLANIDAETTISGGIVQVENGAPTGLLIDNAVELIEIPESSNAQLLEGFQLAEHNCFAAGLTTIDDAGLSRPMIEFIDSLQRAGSLNIRLYAMVSDDPRWLEHYLQSGPYKTDRMNVRSFKFYGDGALGSRGACLRAPYHDDRDNYGLILSSEEHFRESARRLAAGGFQMNTHAIGDSANHLILDVYNDALREAVKDMDITAEGVADMFRWRIEHAQVVSPEDLERFDEYGIIPSVQPTHATSDMYWADERLGEERIHHAYAYNDLLNHSQALPLGTDFPIEQIYPLHTFYAAVVRKDHDGYPEGGFQMENALSREDALRGMTIWAAYSNFEDQEKGSVEVGKFADFTILDTDLLSCGEEQILDAQVLYTIVDGEVVYNHEETTHYE